MSDTEDFDLKIISKYSEVELHFPIVRITEKACQIETQGGNLWLPLSLFQERIYHVSLAFGLLNLLDYLALHAFDSKVRVIKTGNGPTEKSLKCQTVVANKAYSRSGRIFSKKTREIIVSAPVSQLFEENGEFYVPVWVFRRKLQKYEYLTQVSSPSVDALKTEIVAAVSKLRENEKQARLADFRNRI